MHVPKGFNMPPNILIVDDNQTARLNLHKLIKKSFNDTHVIEANSGLAALSITMKQTVDLIILEIQMPQMDGFETAKMLQAQQKTRNIPIVFTTGIYKSEEFQDKAYALGAVDYLTKPIDPTEFKKKLLIYLHFIQQSQNDLKVEQKVEVDAPSEIKKPIPELLQQLHSSIEMIIDCSTQLEKQAIESAYDDCLVDLQAIHNVGEHLLELTNNILAPKMRGK